MGKSNTLSDYSISRVGVYSVLIFKGNFEMFLPSFKIIASIAYGLCMVSLRVWSLASLSPIFLPKF